MSNLKECPKCGNGYLSTTDHMCPMEPISSFHLPEAYNGCQCDCHRVPGVMHVVACCYPTETKIVKILSGVFIGQRAYVIYEEPDNNYLRVTIIGGELLRGSLEFTYQDVVFEFETTEDGSIL